MEYIPDGWNIIEHRTDATDYYVFASWSGSYLYGDSWKRNSGITKVEEDGDDYLFHGYTGSVYRCSKGSEGRITAYNRGVLEKICEISDAQVIPYKDMPI